MRTEHRGKIIKTVACSPTRHKKIYTLAFGDKDSETEKINDKITSNNGDSEIILASVFAFTNKYPQAAIYATGSNPTRTRLYRKGISKYLTDVEKYFFIYGLIGKAWTTFIPGENYEAFLEKRKIMITFVS